jgi:putative CocE/NonD family hydrolase
MVDFGPAAGLEFTATQLDFFDSILGRRSPEPSRPVRYFSMGTNEWRDSTAWPPPETSWKTLFFRSAGRLSGEPPGGDEGHTETTYDPEHPVPTLGGATVPGIPQGPHDHSALDARPDSAVYRSAILDVPLDLAGPVRVLVDADRTAPSTDLTATLSIETDDGVVTNICDGITRWNAGPDSARVEVDLLATAVTIPAGARIHLRISHSGEPGPLATRIGTSRHRIHHNRDRKSYLLLPVMG